MIRAVSQVPIVVATARARRGRHRRACSTQRRGRLRHQAVRAGPARRPNQGRPASHAPSADGAPAPVVIGELRIDHAARHVTLHGLPVDLTPREFDLLELPGLAGRLGGLAARAAHPGVAPAVRELRRHRRRPPVVAASQARRERAAAALPAHRPRGRGQAGGPGRPIASPSHESRGSSLLVGATSSLVLVAFLVPLAVLVRSAAADRALSAAVVEVQALAPTVATTADEATLDQAVDAANAAGGAADDGVPPRWHACSVRRAPIVGRGDARPQPGRA